MAGSVTVSRSMIEYGKGRSKRCEKVSFAITADAADGSMPDTTVSLAGWLIKVVTNPGATAPTANYDLSLNDPLDTTFDALGAALNNRHTTNTEQVYPAIAGSPGTVTAMTPFLAGDYVLKLANNIVNSATIAMDFYLVDEI